MFTGAGSVEVSDRAILATTVATSGNFWISAFCFLMISIACGSEIDGSVTGMNIRSPSFSGGMNSVQIRGARASEPDTVIREMERVITGMVRVKQRTGRTRRT